MNQWFEKKGNLKAPNDASINLVQYQGKECIRFFLREEDLVNDKCKCEIVCLDPKPLELKAAYEFDFNFIIPEIWDDAWDIIWQIHSPDNGFYPNPPLCLQVEGDTIILRNVATEGEKLDLFRVHYEPGIEVKIKIQTKLHWNENGWVKAWVDGLQRTDYIGASIHSDEDGNYLRFGQYCMQWPGKQSRLLYVTECLDKRI